MEKRFAIACAAGIGDALILMIAAQHLRKLGHAVTVFSRHLSGFGRWLPQGEYVNPPDDRSKCVGQFDGVLLQHDNTQKARDTVALRERGLPVYVFYTNYRESKHGPLLKGFDFPFDENQTMVKNTCAGLQALFGGEVDAGHVLKTPPGLVYRKHPHRVALHPMSMNEEKNWPKGRFLKLAGKLRQEGYDPQFILSPQERMAWAEVDAPHFATLEDLTSFIYESGSLIGNDSGPGHIASCLGIPHVIIGRQERQMRLWRPGWTQGEVVCPPAWLPSLKGFRLREKHWKSFITTNQVLRRFKTVLL